jgi:hypothetical protein
MALQSITNINVDFYDKKYIMVNAKQNDKKSRFLLVACYDNGTFFPVTRRDHSAYIKYKKADNYGVFNSCEITDDGKVMVELTEQMLASSGICCADLVIVNRGSAKLDEDTGAIVVLDNASILSTMTFHIDVFETAVENSEIESSYEFDGLNVALEKAESEYSEVIRLTKSYAVGNADGIRENEDTDNAKYYYEQCLDKDANVTENATKSALSEANAQRYMEAAQQSKANAEAHMDNAKTYMGKAEGHMNSSRDYSVVSQRYAVGGTNTVDNEDTDNAKYYYEQCLDSGSKALTSEQNALASETKAKTSEQAAADSALNADTSKAEANNYYMLSRSYAVGDTTTRTDEAIDNAKYYCDQAKMVAIGLSGALLPMGTITFEQLSSVTKQSGYMYNIGDEFISTSEFKDGGNYTYTAGTNVYWTADGYWDCLAGNSLTVATVDEVKDYLGI